MLQERGEMVTDECTGESAADVDKDNIDNLLKSDKNVSSEDSEVQHYDCIKAAGAQGVTVYADHCS